jgi:iron complex outermembrane receptor protein
MNLKPEFLGPNWNSNCPNRYRSHLTRRPSCRAGAPGNRAVSWLIPLLALPVLASDPYRPVASMPRVVVLGTNLTAELRLPPGALLNTSLGDTSDAARAAVVDSSGLLRDLPGTAVVRNGPLTGIPQLRGLWGDRVRTTVDGMTLTPACPNHMDPPLHYAAPEFAERLVVMPGITPVSWGGDSLAGSVRLEPAAPRFHTNQNWHPWGEVTSGYRGADDGFTVGGAIGAANRNFSGSYRGSWQQGDDYRFPGGRVRDTGYDVSQHGLLFAADTLPGVWSLDAGYTRTRDAGTPALPMDMIEDDGYGVGLKFDGEHSVGPLAGRLYHHRTDHLMDNYSLRPAGTNRMFSPAHSADTGLQLDSGARRDRDEFRVGTGFHRNEFDAFQQNAATGRQQDTLHEATRWRVGTYFEWQREWSPRWETVLGARNDVVLMDARDIQQWYAPAAADAARFNARDHEFTDVNFEGMGAVRFRPADWTTLELAGARKVRSPSSLERYLWTPLSASAGQADGRTYLGNLDLDPEASHQVNLTASFHGARWEVRVSPFYNWVSDYIQGTPIGRLDAAGRPVLQYRNVSLAELHGVEANARWLLSTNFTLRGGLSYVRGRNEDTGDHLYRIAPLRGTVALDFRWRDFEATAETVLADEQTNVSAYNNEPVTPGYVVVNLRAGYRFNAHLRLDAGIENLLDEDYADHLDGINRVAGSDVAVGARLPGYGRFAYVSLRAGF